MNKQKYIRKLKEMQPEKFARILQLHKELALNRAIEAFIENTCNSHPAINHDWYSVIKSIDAELEAHRIPLRASNMLSWAFNWASTKEGDAFWRSIYYNIRQKYEWLKPGKL